jgi:hypothetical protein
MYKVRDLAELFKKENGYRKYSLDQFKEWLRKAAPEDDWSEIKIWGIIDSFYTLNLEDINIYDYLFSFGMDPSFLYSDSYNSIKSFENMLKNPLLKYPFQTNEEGYFRIIDKHKKIVSICEKYMTEKEKELALYFYEESKYV